MPKKIFKNDVAEKIFDAIAPAIQHNAWCAYMAGLQHPYNRKPSPSQEKSMIDAMVFFKKYPDATPESNHDNWCRQKVADGWVYGLAKDEDTKQHPDLRPYNELPIEEKNKDIVHLESLRLAVKLANALVGDDKEEEKKE